MFFGKLIAAGCTGLLMSLDWKSSSPSPSARHSAGRPFQTLARAERAASRYEGNRTLTRA